MHLSLSDEAGRIKGLIENALKSCSWVSWDAPSSKREPISQTQAYKIQGLLQGSKLQDIFTLQTQTSTFVELCSYETPEQTEQRIKNANVTTAPFNVFGSLLDMLRSFAEAKVKPETGSAERLSESKHIASEQEMEKIRGYLGTMTASLSKALMDVWASPAAEEKAQREKERKISVILQHLTCHGALGWTDGNMPFVFTCVHPAQSHYTSGASQNIMQAIGDRKRFAQILVKLSTNGVTYDGNMYDGETYDASKVSEVPYILEFSSFLLRQLIVSLSIPKDLMQSYREVLRFMIDLVKKQQQEVEFKVENEILYPLIRGIIFHYPRDTRNSRGGIDDVFWTSGLIEEILDLIHRDDETENKRVIESYRLWAITSIFSLTRVVEFRVLMRDMGMLDIIMDAYAAANPGKIVCKDWDDMVSDMLMNMSERDEIKISLKNTRVLQLLTLFIDNYPGPEDASRLFALVALAHIWGADDDSDYALTGQDMTDKDLKMKEESRIAGKLLEENNLGEWLLEKLLQAMKKGTATIGAAGFTIFLNVEDIVIAIQSLSSNSKAARNMSEKSPRIYGALVQMLKGDRARDPEDNDREVLIKTLTSIRNFTFVMELRDQIKNVAGMTTALEGLKSWTVADDQRIQNLASEVLANFDRKIQKTETTRMDGVDVPSFEVFLSHKQADAKDFVRSLHTLFQAKEISCFLDFEYRGELKFDKIVEQCDNFIFVLTDNVFDSEWCVKELDAAVRTNRNIILVTKEGSKWKDATGNNTLPFPVEELKSLHKDVQKMFRVNKALGHSDEWYQAFTDQLIQRIKENPAARASKKDTKEATLPPVSSPHTNLASAASIGLDRGLLFGIERTLSSNIMTTERSLREQMHGSEQTLAKAVQSALISQSRDISDLVQAQGRSMSELVQAIEQRMSSKLEARMREIKEEVAATSHGIKDAIISLNPSSGGTYGRVALAQSLEDPLEVFIPNQRYAETGSSPMASRSPAAGRTSRLFSARPQSGNPHSRSQGGYRERGVGAGLTVQGYTNYKSGYN